MSYTLKDKYYKNKYYQNNINSSEWFDGSNPKRLTNLKGEIESIKHLAYISKNINTSKLNSGSNSFLLKFNAVGKIILTQGFHENGKIGNETEYLDFYSGRIKFMKWFNKEGEFQMSEENIYSENFIPIGIRKRTSIEENEIIFPFLECEDTVTIETKWFSQEYLDGNLVKQKALNGDFYLELDYHKNGKLKYKCSFKGQLPELEEKFNVDGLIIERTQYKYDSKENVTEKSKYLNIYEDKLKVKTDEIFLRKGHELKQSIIYKYDKQNKLESQYRVLNGKEEKIAALTYNEYGDLINRKFERELTEYRNYKYDKMDNWVEREEWIKGKFFHKYIREINYKK